MIAVTDGVTKNRLLTWLAGRRRSIAYSSMNVPIEFTTHQPGHGPGERQRVGDLRVLDEQRQHREHRQADQQLRGGARAQVHLPAEPLLVQQPEAGPGQPDRGRDQGRRDAGVQVEPAGHGEHHPGRAEPEAEALHVRGCARPSSSQASSAVSTGVMPWTSAVSAAGRPSAIAQ